MNKFLVHEKYKKEGNHIYSFCFKMIKTNYRDLSSVSFSIIAPEAF